MPAHYHWWQITLSKTREDALNQNFGLEPSGTGGGSIVVAANCFFFGGGGGGFFAIEPCVGDFAGGFITPTARFTVFVALYFCPKALATPNPVAACSLRWPESSVAVDEDSLWEAFARLFAKRDCSPLICGS